MQLTFFNCPIESAIFEMNVLVFLNHQNYYTLSNSIYISKHYFLTTENKMKIKRNENFDFQIFKISNKQLFLVLQKSEWIYVKDLQLNTLSIQFHVWLVITVHR